MENLKQSGIYMILNTKNMKSYIGSSINLRKRKAEHFCQLRKGKHYNKHLQNAFNKYKEENFVFIIIERNVERDQLYIRENHHIKEKSTLNRDKGYNMAIPLSDANMVLRPETIELKRRNGYVQFFGEIEDESLYEEWKNKKQNPILLSKEDLQNNARDRFGKILYGICQTTNKILVEYNSVQEAMDKLHNGLRKIIDKENKFISKMAIVSKEKYDLNKDYTKKYAPPYKKKYNAKGPKMIETFNPVTGNTIKKYKSDIELAEDLKITRKYVSDVRRGEKGKGLYKGVGIRWTQ